MPFLDRRDFLKSMGVAAAAWSIPGLAHAYTRREPNIIVINVDDLGWTDLQCYGSRYFDTPNIDRLAAGGMRFTDAYAACAVCSPTRAALMTGRYPARLGITDWIRGRFQGGVIPPDGQPDRGYEGGPEQPLLCPKNMFWLPLDEITVAEALKPSGYTSCHIGKWHLGFDAWYPDKQGFEYNIGGCDFGQPPSYFDPYERRGQGQIPTLRPRQKGEYLTDREADEAVRFIRNHAERRFFLHLAHYAVHTPIQGKQDLIDKYKARPVTNQKDPVYAAMVESVDQSLGRILDTLDELSIAENTLIIFTSDNGGLLGPTDNAPLRSGKGYPYEGGIRVPFIVRWPAVVAPGSVSAIPVSSIDVLPTLCDATRAALPEERTIDGLSLMPILRNTGGLDRDSLFWHFPHYRGKDVVPYSIVRKGDWKLIYYYDGSPSELYNLAEDLAEKHDQAESQPERLSELETELRTWLESTGARLPKPNPDFSPPPGDPETVS